MAEISWRVVVLDEAQAIKNPDAKQTRTVKALKADARVALIRPARRREKF
jgi:SNF2 family DNA or RNA helicase